MLPSEELAQIESKRERITDEEVANLFAEFLRKSPVDTGAFRTAWELTQRIDGTWVITNDMGYASILFEGRRLVLGVWYGSEQWPTGGDVMLAKFNRELQKRLDRI